MVAAEGTPRYDGWIVTGRTLVPEPQDRWYSFSYVHRFSSQRFFAWLRVLRRLPGIWSCTHSSLFCFCFVSYAGRGEVSEYGVHASEIRPEGLCGPEMGIPDSDIGTGSCTVVEGDPNGRCINRGPYGLGQIIKQRSNQVLLSILLHPILSSFLHRYFQHTACLNSGNPVTGSVSCFFRIPPTSPHNNPRPVADT